MTGIAGAGPGRLAEVLATRGGRAEPEAPFVIEHREALIYRAGRGGARALGDGPLGEFARILADYREMLAANPAFDPVRPVMFAKARHGERDDAIPLIADRPTAQCADLFNVSYEILLQILERYFAHMEETDAQLGTLANAASR